jgi:hypothetical protein
MLGQGITQQTEIHQHRHLLIPCIHDAQPAAQLLEHLWLGRDGGFDLVFVFCKGLAKTSASQRSHLASNME